MKLEHKNDQLQYFNNFKACRLLRRLSSLKMRKNNHLNFNSFTTEDRIKNTIK